MPKKRFASQYSKPQTTVHPSFSSRASTSSSSKPGNDSSSSVNELISNLRKTSVNASPVPATITTTTLPPQIRHLLAQPEGLSPKPRTRRRLDANGRRIPPGPAPPRSWLEGSAHEPASSRVRNNERVYPTDVNHLPGLSARGNGPRRRLQDICLRQMARHWEFIREYEINNLAYLPTGLRMEILSVIGVYGPDDGVSFEGLKNIVVPPESQHPVRNLMTEGGGRNTQPEASVPDEIDVTESAGFDVGEHNEGFFRLDLSGSIGNSVFLKQLMLLIEKPKQLAEDASVMDWSWEESITRAPSALLPHLTHLSLSHPSRSSSWRSLLALSKYLPTLTHLSLAHWPVPTLTLNAQTAVMSSPSGINVQYGGTNYYSHSLDGDFREASSILRRLAVHLYGLEYLDLSGCLKWTRALRYGEQEVSGSKCFLNNSADGIDWSNQWLKLNKLKLNSLITLTTQSDYKDVTDFVQYIKEARATEAMLAWWSRTAKTKRVRWIDVEKDDWRQYEDTFDTAEPVEAINEMRKKRIAIKSLQVDGGVQWRGPVIFDDNEERNEDLEERTNIWNE